MDEEQSNAVTWHMVVKVLWSQTPVCKGLYIYRGTFNSRRCNQIRDMSITPGNLYNVLSLVDVQDHEDAV